MSAPKSDFTHIAFLDLETTSLDPETGEILEFGIVITDASLNVIAMKSWVVRPAKLDLLTMHPKVREMHTKNGLFTDVLALEEYEAEVATLAERPYEYYRSTDIHGRVVQIDKWIRATLPGAQHGDLALGGSGVSHFDIRWLNRHAPEIAKWFHRSTLDVGVIRRFIDNVADTPELRCPPVNRDLNHRALDDARNHLEEARHYRKLFRMMPALADESWTTRCDAMCPCGGGRCGLIPGHTANGISHGHLSVSGVWCEFSRDPRRPHP